MNVYFHSATDHFITPSLANFKAHLFESCSGLARDLFALYSVKVYRSYTIPIPRLYRNSRQTVDKQ